MDILYVVGTGSKWQNNELRYSLRSIDRFGRNVGRVYIATEHLPFFINPEKVVHYPIRDLGKIKHLNIMDKIEGVMQHTDIGDDFLLSSDDHFYIRETDFDDYPLYYKGEIENRRDDSEYWRSLRDTKHLLQINGLSVFATNPHCNTHFNRPLYERYKWLIAEGKRLAYCAEVMKEGKQLRYGAEVNCLMGNLMIATGVEPVQYDDIKIKSFKNREDLLRQLCDTHCFSIYDSALNCGIKEYLREMFPNKSRWEK